jgi:hypothetical protein
MKATMADPRDFIPSKYKQDRAVVNSTNNSSDSLPVDSPWNDLAKPDSISLKSTRPLPPSLTTNSKVEDSTTDNTTANNKNSQQKKSNRGLKNKISAFVVVLLLLAGVAVSAYMAQLNQETRQQASGTSPCSSHDKASDCNSACSPVKSHSGESFECKWINDSCKESAQLCSSSGSGDDRIEVINGVPVYVNLKTKTACDDEEMGVWCDGCGGFCLSSTYTGGGCISAKAAKCGEGHTYGAACSLDASTGWDKKCTCNGEDVWFDRSGKCNCDPTTNVCDDSSADAGTNYGLCGVYLNTNPEGIACITDSGSACQSACYDAYKPFIDMEDDTKDAEYTSCMAACSNVENYNHCFTCNENGCSLTGATGCEACQVIHYECKEGTTRCDDTAEARGELIDMDTGLNSATFKKTCETVEQIDVACGSAGYVNSRSRFNASCSDITDTPTAPPTAPPVVAPICSNIEMLDASNITMTGDDDKGILKGDRVFFRASASDSSDSSIRYEFRIWAPNMSTWTDITNPDSGSAAKNVSAAYTIISSGFHTAQARICQGSVCQPWETLDSDQTFADVPSSHWAYAAIMALYNEGIIAGCSTDPLKFCPDESIRRDAMAVLLMKSKFGVSYNFTVASTPIFSDIPNGNIYRPFIEKMYTEGIASGCSSDPLKYCPEQKMTRAQAAVLLVKAKYGKDYSPTAAATPVFSDVPDGNIYRRFIEKLYADGIAAGCSTSPLSFCPDKEITRAEAALLIYNTFFKTGTPTTPPTAPPTVATPPLSIFSDVPVTHWAYVSIFDLYNKNVVAGCSTSPLSFCPDQNIRRDAMSVLLMKAKFGANYSFVAATSPVFADVPNGNIYRPFIEKMYTLGITGGCSTNPLSFCPERNITRAEAAVLLVRAKYGSEYSPSPAVTPIFADVVDGNIYRRFIEQLYADGITSGCSASPLSFCPDKEITRAEAAQLIYHTFFTTNTPRPIVTVTPVPPTAPPTAPPTTPPVSIFSDVSMTHWAYTPILNMYNSGIIAGCSTNPLSFCPDQNIRRDAISVLLMKAKYGTNYGFTAAATPIFADVPNGNIYRPFIEKLYTDGITGGCSTNPLSFCPERNITRDQVAVLLVRAKYGSGYTPTAAATPIFADVPNGNIYRPFIEKLYTDGFTSGCSASPLSYCPSREITRAEATQMIYKMFVE